MEPETETEQTDTEKLAELQAQVARGEAFDLDHMPKVEHNWIPRGIKVSCEGANHPHHSHFVVQKVRR